MVFCCGREWPSGSDSCIIVVADSRGSRTTEFRCLRGNGGTKSQGIVGGG